MGVIGDISKFVSGESKPEVEVNVVIDTTSLIYMLMGVFFIGLVLIMIQTLVAKIVS